MYMDEVIEPNLLQSRWSALAHVSVEKLAHTDYQIVEFGEFISSPRSNKLSFHIQTNRGTIMRTYYRACVDLWDELGLHYEVVNICTGDMGTVAARKYDLEAWLPGADAFKEIVSCSNCATTKQTDYEYDTGPLKATWLSILSIQQQSPQAELTGGHV